MCDAMNRDIVSVILGGYGTKATGGGEAVKFEGETTMTNVDDTVRLLSEAESIICVPGKCWEAFQKLLLLCSR